MKKLLILGFIVLAFFLGTVFSAKAAAPLPLQLAGVQAFRHVLETGDWLVLGRLSLAPTSQTGESDSFTVSTTSGDFDDPVVLVNRVDVTAGTDYTVVADSTDITSFCTLGQDEQTIDCTGTGLADSSYTVVVTYRDGWDAYVGGDVFVQLDDTGTVVAERTAPATGYSLVGIYLTAAEVSALSLTWGDSNVTMPALASPNLWDVPSTATGVISWQATADTDATVTLLTSELKQYLAQLEIDDPDVAAGDYVQPLGITNGGAVVAARAFSLIQLSIPQAFLTSESNPFPDAITTPTVSLIVGIEGTATSTTIYSDFQGVHPQAGLLLTLLGSIILGAVLWVPTRSTSVAGMGWFVGMLAGWLIFAIPFPMVFIPAAAITAAGFMWVAKAVFSE